MNNKYMCDCCGKETEVDEIIFHSDYEIGICPDCYNKMDDDGEYELWYACQDCQFCTADMVHDMLGKLNDKSER